MNGDVPFTHMAGFPRLLVGLIECLGQMTLRRRGGSESLNSPLRDLHPPS